MLGPFATASRLTPIHQGSLEVLSRAACASMSTTSMTTTTRDRGDRYGPNERDVASLIPSCATGNILATHVRLIWNQENL